MITLRFLYYVFTLYTVFDKCFTNSHYQSSFIDHYLKAFKQLQEAASNFERANEKYNSAKGKVADLERVMMDKNRAFDGALQELLNHATVEVGITECYYWLAYQFFYNFCNNCLSILY